MDWQEELLDFMALAMRSEGIPEEKIAAVTGTMTDTLVNLFGEGCELDPCATTS